jgi:protein tyrosine/serine phosphatase
MKTSAWRLAWVPGLILLLAGLGWAAFGLFNETSPAAENAGPTVGVQTTQAGEAAKRGWAEKLERPGLPNLHQVSDVLYRGAQPDPKDTGFAALKKLGVKTIVNLRSLHGESDEVEEAGLAYERIVFNPLGKPEDEEVIRFLKIVSDASKTPAFVHCQHGADRTGTMCAAYRVVVQGWPKDEAVKEMKEGGFNFHAKYYESYAQYITNLDVEKMRKAIARAPAGK